MLGPTHRAFGVAAVTGIYTVIHPWLPPDNFPILGMQLGLMQAGALFGSTLPDIDQKLGTTHRGITHTIWIVGLLSFFTSRQTNPYLFFLCLGVTLGYFSHLFGDAFSKAGIAWCYPLQRYEQYAGGAFHVKGFRGPFVPLYHVGDKTWACMPIIWWLCAGVGTILIWRYLLL